MLIYDIEILKAIPPRNGELLDGIEYCKGFDDHENCGTSVICAYDFNTDRYRVFLKDTFKDFVELAEAHDHVIGFNSISFDDGVCAANGLSVKTTYDLLVEIWAAAGLGPEFHYPSHAGYGLDAMAKINGFSGKTNSGAFAPVNWQRGEYGTVIDYCLEDVRQTKLLLGRVLRAGTLRSPKGPPHPKLRVRRPG